MEKIRLQAGAAKAVISPKADMLPLELAFAHTEYGAVREGEDIHVRALVLDDGNKLFLLESFELGGVPLPDQLHKRIRERFGIERKDALLTATHNHNGPQPFGNMYPGQKTDTGIKAELYRDNQKRWTDYVMDQAITVIEEAISHLRPAKYGFGEDICHININRDELYDDGYWMQGQNWDGCSDKTLAVIKFTDDEDKLIAAVVNYAVHDQINFCSPDTDGIVKVTCGMCGITSQWLENYFGNDAVVLWQSGAAGNQNPDATALKSRRFDSNGTFYSDSKLSVPRTSYRLSISLGEQQAADALRALKKTRADREYMRIKTADHMVEFPGQKFPEGIDRAYHRLMVDNLLVGRGYFKPGEAYEKKLAEMIPTDEKVPMRQLLVILGDIAVVGIGGELYNEIGVLCKEKSPYRKTMITTHIGYPSVGYILDDDSKDRKVFQSFGRIRAGESNEIVVKGMLKLFDETLTDE